MLTKAIFTRAKARQFLIIAWRNYVPGAALCLLIATVSLVVQVIETRNFMHPYVEALVIAILIGTIIRVFWQPGARWQAGIAFSAKQILEVAVALLGASLTLSAIAASGPLLLGAVVGIVGIALAFSYGISRMLGLSRKMSILIACGNSICGNSAIAAVAPVIEASNDEIAASISFTAILGVLAVVGLPILIPLFSLSAKQYGILAGLTVYAVPQVLAATVPSGIVSTQIGTLVKLLRVLLLGPVVISLAIYSQRKKGSDPIVSSVYNSGRLTWMPWFIPGFLLFATFRSLDFIPTAAVLRITEMAGFLTIVSMAALGLGVDLKIIGRIGGKVVAAVALSLFALIVVSLAVARLF